MNEPLQSLRVLHRVLTRLGARPAGRYWRSDWRVFTSNLVAGAVVGAAASIVAAVLLSVDARRGADSFAYRLLADAQEIVSAIQTQIDRELH
ncbi:MAG: hypothetical protein JOY87_04655 [Candidatus Eremiobacteraeota bacterium]|nr:hypothetical protein [Candidatus Eremiobacteraeota bacterium]MBV8263097.1 hypothetical protein [Candidatus Eremiobacteraeota bacterium]MBV8595561.1 hypothetical protein [Candidatus Eremiobacteraeota bacterium]